MTVLENVRTVVPNVTRNVPGGGGLLWRLGSRGVISSVGFGSKGLLRLQRDVQVEGMDQFLRILRGKRDRGIITVSNHLSVLDDPLLWGILPLSVLLRPQQNRWALGASDILFTNPLYSLIFSLGQTLPINRYSLYRPRGIQQPSMNHAVHLLSDPYHAWIHIFPEARVYQAPDLPMRFFKMGISKLILEPDRTPLVIPMFHSGMEKVMVEGKIPPQFVPSLGQEIRVKFGEPMDLSPLQGFRARWEKVRMHPTKGDVRALRIETAERVREAVNAVRASMGFPPEPPGSNDPKSFPHDPSPSRKQVKKWFSWWAREKG